jgi:hypothetical protein
LKQILIIIDNKILEEYYTYYFKKYPRRHKKPIDKPIPPSLNQWSVAVRNHANNLKQNWKDFIIWIVNKCNYQNMNIDKCTITYKYYFPSKLRRDCDNYNGKFICDGLVESGLIVDDSFFHVNPLTIFGFYDKNNPRTEILIEYNGEKNKG